LRRFYLPGLLQADTSMSTHAYGVFPRKQPSPAMPIKSNAEDFHFERHRAVKKIGELAGILAIGMTYGRAIRGCFEPFHERPRSVRPADCHAK
jgi:hypothetical protein